MSVFRFLFIVLTVLLTHTGFCESHPNRSPIEVKIADGDSVQSVQGFLTALGDIFSLEFPHNGRNVSQHINREQFGILKETRIAKMNYSLDLHYRAPGTHRYGLELSPKEFPVSLRLMDEFKETSLKGKLVTGGEEGSHLLFSDNGKPVDILLNSQMVRSINDQPTISINRNLKLHYRAPGTYTYELRPQAKSTPVSIAIQEGSTQKTVQGTLITGEDFSGKGRLEFRDSTTKTNLVLEPNQVRTVSASGKIAIDRSLVLHYRAPGTHRYAIRDCGASLKSITN